MALICRVRRMAAARLRFGVFAREHCCRWWSSDRFKTHAHAARFVAVRRTDDATMFRCLFSMPPCLFNRPLILRATFFTLPSLPVACSFA